MRRGVQAAPAVVAGLALLLCTTLPSAGMSQSRSAGSAAAVLAADKGKFRILLDGQPVGSEEFEIKPAGAEWLAHGSTELRLPGGEARVTATLKLAADGSPVSYEWTSQGAKKVSATVDFQNGTAKMALRFEGAQPFIQELSFGSARLAVLDNNLYHQYAILARLYDWKARGAQTLSVLIPQEMTPGSITLESMGPQDVEGVALELLRVRTSDIEIDLYLDSSHRMVRLAVPASKVLLVRE